jgi:hypothetical protein
MEMTFLPPTAVVNYRCTPTQLKKKDIKKKTPTVVNYRGAYETAASTFSNQLIQPFFEIDTQII